MSKTIDIRDYGWRGFALFPFVGGILTFVFAGAGGYGITAFVGMAIAIVCGFIMPRQMRKDLVARD